MGTRGDVQPFAILGKALQVRGHEVMLCTAKNHERLVSSYGLSFRPVEADYQAILDSDEGKKLLKANPFVIRRNLKKWIYPLVRQPLNEFYALSSQSDKVIYHIKTMADCFAEKFPYKMIRAMVVPAVEATKAFPNPAFSGFPVPAFLNRLSYGLSDLGIKILSNPIKEFRMGIGIPGKFRKSQLPFLYGISNSFLERPPDYPEKSIYTGFWFGNSPEPLDADLLNFIQAGEKPILVSFGSMPFRARFDLGKALSNLSSMPGVRIIVIKGWGIGDIPELASNDQIKIVGAAPYDKLFPLIKAVIHHGGIGTTAECIRAGLPFFICPVFYPVGDQMFWGKVAWRKGIALKPIPLEKISEARFISKVKELLATESLFLNARELSRKIEKENGVEIAIREIEK